MLEENFEGVWKGSVFDRFFYDYFRTLHIEITTYFSKIAKRVGLVGEHGDSITKRTLGQGVTQTLWFFTNRKWAIGPVLRKNAFVIFYDFQMTCVIRSAYKKVFPEKIAAQCQKDAKVLYCQSKTEFKVSSTSVEYHVSTLSWFFSSELLESPALYRRGYGRIWRPWHSNYLENLDAIWIRNYCI